MSTEYDPESYWSQVAERIRSRGRESYLAGDDNPFLRYKRSKFLRTFLDSIDVNGKVVLEIGCGPGGNLLHLAARRAPKALLGVDISQQMVQLARANLARHNAEAAIHKIDGQSLPFEDKSVDLSFTVTVLSHTTDGVMLRSLVSEACRVTSTTIAVIEGIGDEGLSGHGSYIARRVDVYASVFGAHGFSLSECRYLNTRFSRSWYFLVQKFAGGKQPYQEGETMAFVPRMLVASILPLTALLDPLYPDMNELTKMVFQRVTQT